jgi:hypothetical protein
MLFVTQPYDREGTWCLVNNTEKARVSEEVAVALYHMGVPILNDFPHLDQLGAPWPDVDFSKMQEFSDRHPQRLNPLKQEALDVAIKGLYISGKAQRVLNHP